MSAGPSAEAPEEYEGPYKAELEAPLLEIFVQPPTKVHYDEAFPWPLVVGSEYAEHEGLEIKAFLHYIRHDKAGIPRPDLPDFCSIGVHISSTLQLPETDGKKLWSGDYGYAVIPVTFAHGPNQSYGWFKICLIRQTIGSTNELGEKDYGSLEEFYELCKNKKHVLAETAEFEVVPTPLGVRYADSKPFPDDMWAVGELKKADNFKSMLPELKTVPGDLGLPTLVPMPSLHFPVYSYVKNVIECGQAFHPPLVVQVRSLPRNEVFSPVITISPLAPRLNGNYIDEEQTDEEQTDNEYTKEEYTKEEYMLKGQVQHIARMLPDAVTDESYAEPYRYAIFDGMTFATSSKDGEGYRFRATLQKEKGVPS